MPQPNCVLSPKAYTSENAKDAAANSESRPNDGNAVPSS